MPNSLSFTKNSKGYCFQKQNKNKTERTFQSSKKEIYIYNSLYLQRKKFWIYIFLNPFTALILYEQIFKSYSLNVA